MVLFTFDDKNEMEKVMVAEPWSFGKRLMVLQRYGKEKDLGDVEFNKVTFWVQVHDLPIRFRTRKIAEQLCEAIGKVNVGIDDVETEGDNFLRVRVTMDISQPLCRGRVISLDSGKDLWVPFKYERLPSLCFWCGCLTHNDRDCEVWVESEGCLSPESQQFGPWLKAVLTRRYMEKEKCAAKKALVVVVRSGKITPEIVRTTNKESLDSHAEGDMDPVFMEVNKDKSRLSTEEEFMEDVTIHEPGYGECDNTIHDPKPVMEKVLTDASEEEIREMDKEIKKHDIICVRPPSFGVDTGKEILLNQACDVKLHQPMSRPCDVKPYQPELAREKLLAKAFEEEIRELDREIKKYDRKFTGPPGFGVGIGKEIVVPSIYEPNVPCPTAHAANTLDPAVHATQLSPSTCMPLAKIPNSPVHHVHVEGTWKRLTRKGWHQM